MQRSPLARRHAIALAALLAIGAAALGVAISQLYQDKPSQDRSRGDAVARDALPSDTSSGTGANPLPLFDPTALANNTARLSAAAGQPVQPDATADDAARQNAVAPSATAPSAAAAGPALSGVATAAVAPPPQAPAPTTPSQDNVAQPNAPAPAGTLAAGSAPPSASSNAPARTVASAANPRPSYATNAGARTDAARVAAATARTLSTEHTTPSAATPRSAYGGQFADGARTRGAQSSVSLAEARAATAALTQEAIAPLSPAEAAHDAMQPRVDYVPGTHTATSDPRIPPSAAEATAELTAKATAIPPPQPQPKPARVLAPTILPPMPHTPAAQPAAQQAPADDDQGTSPDDQ